MGTLGWFAYRNVWGGWISITIYYWEGLVFTPLETPLRSHRKQRFKGSSNDKVYPVYHCGWPYQWRNVILVVFQSERDKEPQTMADTNKIQKRYHTLFLNTDFYLERSCSSDICLLSLFSFFSGLSLCWSPRMPPSSVSIPRIKTFSAEGQVIVKVCRSCSFRTIRFCPCYIIAAINNSKWMNMVAKLQCVVGCWQLALLWFSHYKISFFWLFS